MVRVIKASTNDTKESHRKFTTNPSETETKTIFSPNQVLLLLQSIAELQGLELDYETHKDGSIDFVVGNNVYQGINLA